MHLKNKRITLTDDRFLNVQKAKQKLVSYKVKNSEN